MSRRFAPIYPAYTFHESKTWHAWVKFTAADVFALKEKPGFEGDTKVATEANEYMMGECARLEVSCLMRESLRSKLQRMCAL